MDGTGEKAGGRRGIGQTLGALLAVSALILTGLMPAARAQQGIQAGTKPGYGGSIAVANQQPDCLDPQKTGLAASDAVFSQVVDPLVFIDDRGHLRPNLALRWTVSHGGRLLTFHLRHGVRFSNGDPLDANAVRYTFDRALNPAIKSPITASNLSVVRTVKVVSRDTVQLVLKTPSRPLMTFLADSYEGILDPRVTGKQGNGSCQNPIGTGPFKVSSVGPGFSSVTLVRNPYHTWETPAAHNHGRAYLARLVFKTITSDATRVSELLTGDVDITSVAGAQIGRVKGNRSIALHSIPAQGEAYLGFNFAHPPFDTLAVRRAVAEAIDREAIVKAALDGLGEPVYAALPPTVLNGLPTATARRYAAPYNPSDARRIVATRHAAGPYTLLVPQLPQFQATGELLQAELTQVGMTVKVVAKPVPDYLSMAGRGQFDLNLWGWTYNDPDVLFLLFHSSQGKGAGGNFTNYSGARLDDLLVRGRETLNNRKARSIYQQIQVFMARKSFIVPLALSTQPTAVRSRVKGWHFVRPANETLYQDAYVPGK